MMIDKVPTHLTTSPKLSIMADYVLVAMFLFQNVHWPSHRQLHALQGPATLGSEKKKIQTAPKSVFPLET